MPLGYFRFMDQPIRSRVASPEYRKNWDAVFGRRVDVMEAESVTFGFAKKFSGACTVIGLGRGEDPPKREYAIVTPKQAKSLLGKYRKVRRG